MLQSQTVDASTLELLKALMQLPDLAQFHLVGGTNLSLRFGHRLSIDIDLFTNESFEPLVLFQSIKNAFPQAELKSSTRSMLFFYINDVKIDCVLAPFPYLNPIEVIDDIRFVSTPDVIAMKLGAMSSRGVKKDFWDIAELLNHYKLEEMLSFFAAKYNAHDPFFVIRSLTYFEDAEHQIDPQPLKKITWNQVKKKVEKAVKDFLK